MGKSSNKSSKDTIQWLLNPSNIIQHLQKATRCATTENPSTSLVYYSNHRANGLAQDTILLIPSLLDRLFLLIVCQFLTFAIIYTWTLFSWQILLWSLCFDSIIQHLYQQKEYTALQILSFASRQLRHKQVFVPILLH